MDSRYPTHYLTDRRVERLTDRQHRLLVTATAWSVSNRTDGVIEREDLTSAVFLRFDLDDIGALVTAGLWEDTPTGWRIADYQRTQTSAAQMEAAMEARRESDRARSARLYAKKRAAKTAPEEPTPDSNSRESHVRNVGKARRGEERQGEASSEVSSEQTRPTLATAPTPVLQAGVPDHDDTGPFDLSALTPQQRTDVEWGLRCDRHPVTSRPDYCPRCAEIAAAS